jgi:hypothetical protein
MRVARGCNLAKATLLAEVDGHKEGLTGFLGADFGKIDVQVAAGIVLAFFLRRRLPVLVQWQAAHPVALKTAVQRRAREVRDGFS